MLLLNPTNHRVVIAQLDGLVVEPGAEVEIEDGYCRLHKTPSKTTESTIRLLAPQLIPVDEQYRAEWERDGGIADLAPAATALPSAAALEAQGMAPGVAALIASGSAAPVPQPPKAKAKTSTAG